MGLPKLTILKESGLGRKISNIDNTSGIIAYTNVLPSVTPEEGEAVVMAEGEIVELNSLTAAINKGITQSFDETNGSILYRIIEQFFNYNKRGKLFLQVYKATAYSETHLSSFVGLTKGVCRQILWGEMDATILAALTIEDIIDRVEDIQLEIDTLFQRGYPVQVLLPGWAFGGDIGDAEDLRALNGKNVAIVIGSDYNLTTKLSGETTPWAKAPEVGLALAYLALAKVNENIGWVDKFPLTDTKRNQFEEAGLSDGSKLTDFAEDELDVLHDKGYIFARPVASKTGYWWNSSSTCCAITEDEAYLENGRTLDKASRLIREALSGDINGPIPLTEDGKITPIRIGSLESKAEVKLSQMSKEGEISAYDVYIDPDQNFIENDEVLELEFTIVPIGVARQISCKLKLSASL